MPATTTAPRRQVVTSLGACCACDAELTKASMRGHVLTKCPERKAGTQERFLITVTGRGASEYWLFLDAAPSVTLGRLDSLLRQVWLECCGHLSAFEIAGHTYESDPDYGSKGMGTTLGRVLEPGLAFSHVYDYGSSTSLVLRVSGIRTVAPAKEAVRLLAQNLPLSFECECGQPAKQICTECMYSLGPEAVFCETCLGDHDCGDDYALPLVNSPRVGVCGYSGD